MHLSLSLYSLFFTFSLTYFSHYDRLFKVYGGLKMRLWLYSSFSTVAFRTGRIFTQFPIDKFKPARKQYLFSAMALDISLMDGKEGVK